MRLSVFLAVFCLLFLIALTPAYGVTVNVPGTSNPYLAGMPAGTIASLNDVAPDQSPVQVLPWIAAPALTFSASGLVGHPGDDAGPDGAAGAVWSHYPDGKWWSPDYSAAENGISNSTVPINALLGVFLDDNEPWLTPAPGALDFSTDTSRDFLTLSPALKQLFFIGDGLTSTNVTQVFNVPVGATRLFLGTMDGYEWNNNYGSFDVTVNGVPLPTAAWAGIALLGTLTARKLLRPCAA
jgi:hypothetical protein